MPWTGTHERRILEKARSYYCAVFAAIVIATLVLPDIEIEIETEIEIEKETDPSPR
jgi:hypothetical protein